MLAINDRWLLHMGMLAICDHRFPFLTHRTQTSMAEKVKMHQRSSLTKLNESVQREEESCTMAKGMLYAPAPPYNKNLPTEVRLEFLGQAAHLCHVSPHTRPVGVA